MKPKLLAFIIFLTMLLHSCDIYAPKRAYTLVVPDHDYFYNYVTGQIVPFFQENGIAVKVLTAASVVEANRMVARGEADLCFVNNHSIPVPEEIGVEAGRLRTLLPITTRLFFAFTRSPQAGTIAARKLFEGKKIGLEVLGGEAEFNLERMLNISKITGSKLVGYDDAPDVIVFWGTFYGKRASQFIAEGWHPVSFDQTWVDFIALNNPALRPFKLPAIPGDEQSIEINTLATDVLLSTHSSIGENAIYELCDLIFGNKLALLHKDLMYQGIRESFDQQYLLYPLHEGTASYLRRDQPSFFERYADTIALVLSIIAVLYGGIQAVRNKIAKRKKDQVDSYLLDFLDIRQNRELANEDKIKNLDLLFKKALEQMTNEKLEKADFHILSRLIQQEVTILKFRQ
ncbi:MAG: ABC transporter substrate-binding protein [Bacteroidota bacterium]|jgi:TRAP-type uncharacterized transport system substrate-binding protein|nr:ABC transporter substrate-binding protein [Cytophagales bacterium]MCE2955563.1 ABC transporter substrate-binding protein [Flammeovirgaceae bacterium]